MNAFLGFEISDLGTFWMLLIFWRIFFEGWKDFLAGTLLEFIKAYPSILDFMSNRKTIMLHAR